MFEYPEIQKELHTYNDECRSLAVGAIKHLLKSGLHLPNQAMFEKIASQSANIPPVSEKNLHNNSDKATEKETSLLKLLNGLNQNSISQNGVFNFEKLPAEMKTHLANLEYDKVWNFSWGDRSVIDQMDIPIPNTKGFFIKVAVLEPTR